MNSNFFTDPDVFKTAVVLFTLILVSRFILLFLKKILDHKIKNRIIDKGLSSENIAFFLQNDKTDESSENFRWFLLLCFTGIGLFITAAFPPIGIHSFAIMAICISLGFLSYSYYLKRFANK